MDPPTTVPQVNGSCSLQLRAGAFAPCAPSDIQIQDSCYGDLHQPQQQQQQQQLLLLQQQKHCGDRMAPSTGHCAATDLDNGGSTSYYAPLSPLSALWCHGLSSDADYYGPGMVGLTASLPPSSPPVDSSVQMRVPLIAANW